VKFPEDTALLSEADRLEYAAEALVNPREV
jgi:hypothetical protein